LKQLSPCARPADLHPPGARRSCCLNCGWFRWLLCELSRKRRAASSRPSFHQWCLRDIDSVRIEALLPGRPVRRFGGSQRGATGVPRVPSLLRLNETLW